MELYHQLTLFSEAELLETADEYLEALLADEELRDHLPLITDMLERGATRKEIAEKIGCSSPAITQFVRREPSLRRFRARGTLHRQRDQLLVLRHEALQLAGEIRRNLRILNEELEADRIDRLLKLR